MPAPVDKVVAGIQVGYLRFFMETSKMDSELFQPFDGLIQIQIQGRYHRVPRSNLLLRCFQYLCMEDISYGRFCWNQDCKTCAISYELESGEQETRLSCQMIGIDGMKIVRISKELKWALRSILQESSSQVDPAAVR